jgi:hypothetical protein
MKKPEKLSKQTPSYRKLAKKLVSRARRRDRGEESRVRGFVRGWN